jgi:mRNA interferase MazF
MQRVSLRTPERGEIWPTAPEVLKRSSRRGVRDVLVVQCAELLRESHPFTVVIPLTSELVDGAEPLRIRIAPVGRLRYSADLMIDQVFALETDKLQQGPLARLEQTTMERVEEALLEILGFSS